jgi:hypothetical protein
MACWNTPTTEVDRNKLRHQLEIKLAIGQPFNSEHGTGTNRTAQMDCCVSLAWAVRAEQIAAA